MTNKTIAVVTGASRGAGKGIAIALGTTGATVYVTGRSVSGKESPVGGSIAETAAAVDAAGGKGIAVPVDHADDATVAALFKRVRNEHGRLDILVNNAAKLVASVHLGPFWKQSIEEADVITVGLRSHYVSSYHATPLLIANGKGLIVNTGFYGAVSYFYGPAYGAQKAGEDKMAADMAKELRPYNVSVNSIWMGRLDTERARVNLASQSEGSGAQYHRESPQFTGHVIAALYASPERMILSGRALIGAELAIKFGITDIDGRQPPSYRDTLGAPPELHPSLLG